jgi:hypothetical protein
MPILRVLKAGVLCRVHRTWGAADDDAVGAVPVHEDPMLAKLQDIAHRVEADRQACTASSQRLADIRSKT